MNLYTRVQLVLTGLILFAAFVHIVHYTPLLPDTVASHFDFAGKANGWSSKESVVLLFGSLFAFVAGVFVALAFLIRKIPPALINMPNKSYWLAPERRDAAFRFLTGRILEISNATLVFLLLLFRATAKANLTAAEEPRLGGESLIAFVLYFGFLAVWMVRFYTSLRKPRPEPKPH